MPDITPRLAAGRQLINAYGDGGFRIAGNRYEGSVIVLPERTLVWSVTTLEQIAIGDLAPVLAADPAVELLLLGVGRQLRFVPRALRDAVKAAGIGFDGMDTGAACRTFNVLLAEERRVAAALIAVD